MSSIKTGFDDDYKKWISNISNRFRASQIKASIKVNDESECIMGKSCLSKNQ